MAKIHAGSELLYYQEAVETAKPAIKRSIAFEEAAQKKQKA